MPAALALALQLADAGGLFERFHPTATLPVAQARSGQMSFGVCAGIRVDSRQSSA